MAKVQQNHYIEKLSSINFEKISETHSFQKGNSHKISLFLFINSFIQCIERQSFTLYDWTTRIMFIGCFTLVKQAIQAKFYERHYNSVEAVLAAALSDEYQNQIGTVRNWPLFKTFNRVLIEDSTCLHLHPSLATIFPGATSKGVKGATARIQTIYELKKEQFLDFTLQSFRDNDQKHANKIIDLLQADDLVLRDLGYYIIETLRKIINVGAFFVTPYKSGTKLFTEKGQELNLYNILVVNGLSKIDYTVLLGAEAKLPVRLVAVKLSQEAHQKKIANAKKTASGTTNHSKEYYELLGWAIYITNVPCSIWSIRDIGFAYRVRWRIETIFKAWKSSFKIKDFAYERKMCEHRCKIQLTIFLIYFTLIFKTVFAYFETKVKEEFAKNLKNNRYTQLKELSLIKLAKLIQTSADFILHEEDWEKLIPIIIKATAYENRKDRTNFENFTY